MSHAKAHFLMTRLHCFVSQDHVENGAGGAESTVVISQLMDAGVTQYVILPVTAAEIKWNSVVCILLFLVIQK